MSQKSTKKPKVSVIVATHNQERFIGRCLRSLLNQSIPHDEYEIIVIDDGSNDRTPFALELFHDAICILTNPNNIGLAASLNIGINASRSEYIVRVDSDDYVNKNFLNFLYVYLDWNKDVDAVACDYILINDSDEWLQRLDCSEHPIACGVMFRKTCLQDIGLYDETFRCHEDQDLRIRFEKKFKIDKIKLPLYRYRRHLTNLTNNSQMMETYQLMIDLKHGLKG